MESGAERPVAWRLRCDLVRLAFKADRTCRPVPDVAGGRGNRGQQSDRLMARQARTSKSISRLGKQPSRYRFFLNPYTDVRFTTCPTVPRQDEPSEAVAGHPQSRCS